MTKYQCMHPSIRCPPSAVRPFHWSIRDPSWPKRVKQRDHSPGWIYTDCSDKHRQLTYSECSGKNGEVCINIPHALLTVSSVSSWALFRLAGSVRSGVCFWGLVDNAYVVYLYGDRYRHVSVPGEHMHAVYQSTGMTRCEERWICGLGFFYLRM